MQRPALLLVCLLLGSALGRPSHHLLGTEASGRIIGGTSASIGDFPWQASFQQLGRHACGASIISSSWLLTAAHCVDGISVSWMSFRVGSSVRESGGTVLQATTGYVHAQYVGGAYDYDVAVVQVSGSLLGSNSRAVGLPSDGYDPAGGLAVTVTGWGLTRTGAAAARTLQKVDVSVADRSYCQGFFSTRLTSRMVCAGQPGRSVCNGDSGGPLVSGGTQVGIVSWGSSQCEAAPGVYSNVGNLRSWIRQATGV